MKTRILFLLLVGALLKSVPASAADTAGPNGGRLLGTPPDQAEFVVRDDRTAEISFLDPQAKPQPVGERQVTLIAQTGGQSVHVPLVATDIGFRSSEPLPPGEPYRLVIQVRASPEASPQNYRLDLNLSECAECGYQEYACTCVGH